MPRSGVEPAVGEGQDGDALMTVGALRSAAEQLAMPLQVGTPRQARGAARARPADADLELPSHGRRAADGDALARNPLLVQLVRSMQARVIRHDDGAAPTERLAGGMCVLRLDAATPAAIVAAVAQGARRILCIPPDAPMPGRILVHAGDAAHRSDLLALLSSVMRHLPVEATAVTLQRPEAGRSEVIEAQRAARSTRAPTCAARTASTCAPIASSASCAAGWPRLPRNPSRSLVVLGLPAGAAELAASLERDLAPLFVAGTRTLGAVCDQCAAMTPAPPRSRAARSGQRQILPGFGLTMGYTVTYLSLIVLVPLAAAFLSAGKLPIGQWLHVLHGAARAGRLSPQHPRQPGAPRRSMPCSAC